MDSPLILERERSPRGYLHPSPASLPPYPLNNMPTALNTSVLLFSLLGRSILNGFNKSTDTV